MPNRSDITLSHFVETYLDRELTSWQEELVEAVARGEHLTIMAPPRAGIKRATIIGWVALQELRGTNYHVIGSDEHHIVNEGRQLAKRFMQETDAEPTGSSQ